MKALLAALVVALGSSPALATEKHKPRPISPPAPAHSSDNWGGAAEHFVVSGAAGVVCAAHIYPKESLKAFGCALVPGLIKETIDSTQRGNRFSGRDMVANAVGAAVGVYTGGLLLSYNERTRTTTVALNITLK